MKPNLFCLLLFVLLPVVGVGQIITTFAGTGVGGNTGNGGPATAAKVQPYNCTFDKFGNFYISQYMGHQIRKVDTAGIITTVAGTGMFGFGGDGGPATAALFKFPDGLACDTSGNLFISDRQNFRIRKIDVSTGIISTYAGSGIAGDAGDGGPATVANFFPTTICFDKHGNLFISDNTYHKIKKITSSTGIITTYAGTGILGFSGDGGPATAAKFYGPAGLGFDSWGNLYVSDAQNKRIRKIDTMGTITTIGDTGLAVYTGDGTPSISTNMGPLYFAIDNNNNIYFGDSTSRIRKIDTAGIVHTITGTGVLSYN